MEKCAGIIIYTFIVGALIGIFALGYYFWDHYQDLKDGKDKHDDNEDNFFWAAVVTWGIGVLLVLTLLCMCSRIRIAIMLIEAAADFITDVTRILLVPIVLIIVFFAFMIYWVITGAYIFSTGMSRYEEDMPFGEMKWDKETE